MRVALSHLCDATLLRLTSTHCCPPTTIFYCRVKRSLSGAVAAAGGSGPALARRSLDIGAAAALPPQLLAGCSRKRGDEADLVSPPMPRKSSRTLLELDTADMMARLHLQTSGGGAAEVAPPPASKSVAWAPSVVAVMPPLQPAALPRMVAVPSAVQQGVGH